MVEILLIVILAPLVISFVFWLAVGVPLALGLTFGELNDPPAASRTPKSS